ncbi:MAG: hypothetical protein IIU65_00215 [Clostridia bacterium]|nr:hypothetical protein [Clostridia bacterium]
MTFAEKFQSLKVAFDKADIKKFDAFFAIQFTMTDEDCGGTFYIEYKDGNYSVEPYDYYDNTAVVIATASSIAKLSKGTFAKDLVVDGNVADVKTLASSLKVAKAPAKKKAVAKKATTPVVKKTTVKKDTKAAK